MEPALETLQLGVVRLITAQPYFAQVPVIHERMKNLESELNKALNVLKGIAILVLTPSGKNSTPGSPQVDLLTDVAVEVSENVTINTSAKGTQLKCSAVAEQVAAHLHHGVWTPGKALVHDSIEEIGNEELVIYQVKFTTRVKLVAL